MDSLQVTDAQSQAVQKTPNRVSLEDIENSILHEFTFIAGDAAMQFASDVPLKGPLPQYAKSLEVLTICVITMQNGFTIIGKSAPADAANFDAALGAKFAREDAIRQVWPLMGYVLREKLAFPS